MNKTSAGQMSLVDVAVVGLGPVGITLCTILGQRGLSVVGIDQADDIYALPRAMGMDHEVMRVFQNIGVADQLETIVSSYRDSEYRAADGSVLRRFISPPPPHSQGWPAYMTFIQPKLEGELRLKAAMLDNVRLITNTAVTSIGNPETPRLTLEDSAGNTTILEAQYVVGCDGGSSFVRRSLGIVLEDLIFDQPWLVVDMILSETAPRLPETNIQFCDPARPHTFVIGPGQLRRWEFMLMPGENPETINQPEWIWQQLSPWLKPGQAQLWRSAAYRFHALVAERWRSNKVFLAGDACHMTPPFLAQGMVQGIKDAANLGWKLAYAVKHGSEHLLDSYEQERQPVVREVVSITKELGQIICETDTEKAATRNADMMAVVNRGKGTFVRQSLFPPIRHGLIGRDSNGRPLPGAGEPCPQPFVRSHGGPLQRLDDVLGHDFNLLVDGLHIGEQLHARIIEAGLNLCTINGENDVYEEEAVLSGWMSVYEARAIISRPDHVVFGTARTESDLASLVEQLLLQLKVGSEKGSAIRPPKPHVSSIR
ncbi:bifunctional 3-(3-hydroxy-phenyl)propionate/3-hydroxycinnamic acid hydroxylase [Agrobacterium pusense]|uniref:bifunctional 3-(3-hydroxy-phenyl)propionate/3-hydroxycinnamic acid hydroxylase n=1 Tax=Agrobacterium pusense TaxID=648995 RepID=UPI003FD651C1